MDSTDQNTQCIAETQALQAVRDLLATDFAPFEMLGAPAPRALLLSGPPGVGKTRAVQIAADEASLPVFCVSPGSQVRRALTSAFRSAMDTVNVGRNKQVARIVFIDEIDTICPAPSSGSSDANPTSATSLLLSLMDPPPKINLWAKRRQEPKIFVIAATNRPNAVHLALRRAGRFDREVALEPPTAADRYKLLRALEQTAEEGTLRDVADRTPGFVTADLAALIAEAKIATKAEDELLDKEQTTNVLSAEHFEIALRRVRPSVLRQEIATEVPRCSWDDIGGLEHVKERLQMAVEWPLRYSESFKRLGLKPPRGILLHGPPGCSKTTLVRAAASQSHAAFIRLNGADIYSCYLGEAERILRDAFGTARAASPSILFLDEIDAIVGKRSLGGEQSDGNGVQERVLSTLLTEMDGIVSSKGVLVIGATNRVDLLDDALLRPGRFDDILKVDLPDEATRLRILRMHSKKLPLDSDVDLEKMAKQTEGWSGADLKSICTEAGLAALRERYECSPLHASKDEIEDDEIRVSLRHFGVKTSP